MAQAALSLAAFQTAYPSAEPVRPAPPRVTYVETGPGAGRTRRSRTAGPRRRAARSRAAAAGSA
ncbi:hypothetical protein MOF8_02570 [Methylobacterium oryzae]